MSCADLKHQKKKFKYNTREFKVTDWPAQTVYCGYKMKELLDTKGEYPLVSLYCNFTSWINFAHSNSHVAATFWSWLAKRDEFRTWLIGQKYYELCY